MNRHTTPNPQMDRREWLKRLLGAAGVIGALGAAGILFYDGDGPPPPGAGPPALTPPDFLDPDQKGKMAVAHGPDRKKSLSAALAAIGGMSAFVRPGDRVVLKVNAAFASPPAISATTHPDLVAEAARQCFAAGAESVVVTDNPINDPAACFELTGIARAAREAGAKVALPRPESFSAVTVPGSRLIRKWPMLHEPLRGANRLIGLAPVKDHHRSGASMSIKNWYGLLGGRRNVFHQDIHVIIAELALMARPTLVILDGTVTMLRNGPTGGSLSDLKQTHTMIVSTDPVAADALGATLLEKTAADLPHLSMAEAAGAGTTDYRSLNPKIITGA